MAVKKLLLWLVFLIILKGSALADPGRFAYVLRFDGPKDLLIQFDTDKDEIVKEIPLPADSGYNNFIVDESGGCYIAKYRNSWTYGNDIYYYDPAKDKIEHLLNLKDCSGPRYMALTKDALLIEAQKNSESPRKDGRIIFRNGIIFVDRKIKQVTDKVIIQKGPEYSQANINDIYFDGGKYLFFTSFYVESISDEKLFDSHGGIYVVDVGEKKIVKTIEVPREYTFIDGICNIGDKIYVAAMAKGERSEEWKGGSPPNTELLVFSFEKGKLIKKIKISPHPFKLYYDPSVGKLYVEHMDDKYPRNEVEVIDPRTDKIIKTLTIPSQLMFSVVKPGKMYITVGEAFLTPTRTEPALLVLDTKTDKIIKTIYGNYKGISFNPFN